MPDPDDPLDLLQDDNDPVVEICLMEEEAKNKNGAGTKRSGCSVLLLLLGSSLLTAGWWLY